MKTQLEYTTQGIRKSSITLLILSVIHFVVILLAVNGLRSGGIGSIEDTYSVVVLYLILFSMICACIGLIFAVYGFTKRKSASKCFWYNENQAQEIYVAKNKFPSNQIHTG